MRNLKLGLLATTVACVALAGAQMASAGTVTTETTIKKKYIENRQSIDFSAFDMNNDMVLSKAEVGEKLFYLFDVDGNEVIDNLEFDDKRVFAVTPMEKETYTYVDYDSDGTAEQVTYDYDLFFETSGLVRFDKDLDGISAEEFINASMLELDNDNSKMIELDEWKNAYVATYTSANADQERYN